MAMGSCLSSQTMKRPETNDWRVAGSCRTRRCHTIGRRCCREMTRCWLPPRVGLPPAPPPKSPPKLNNRRPLKQNTIPFPHRGQKMSAEMTNRRRPLKGIPALMAGAAVMLAGLMLPVVAQESTRQPAQAQTAQPPDAKLPSAEEVLKKYIEATGGAEAYEALKTQHASGTFSMPAMQMEGKFELFQEQPDKFLALVTLPGMGEIQTGLNGKTGWRTDPMQGPRLLEGEELKSLGRDADMQAVLKPQDHYDSMEVKGIEDVNGEKAYHLVFTPKGGGNAIDAWYSVESGLQLKTSSTDRKSVV